MRKRIDLKKRSPKKQLKKSFEKLAKSKRVRNLPEVAPTVAASFVAPTPPQHVAEAGNIVGSVAPALNVPATVVAAAVGIAPAVEPAAAAPSPKSLEAFTRFVEAAVAGAGQQLWYRGAASEDYTLTPTLFRHPTRTAPEDLFELERHTIDWFKRRSVPYVRLPGLEEDIDYMFLMQHHGAPTRLLDWTENPFVALFFALTSKREGSKPDGTPYSPNPCIWILDPHAWNKHTLQHQAHPGYPLSPKDDVVGTYLKNRDIASLPKYPIALFGTHNSQRIVSQRGVFCLFGKDVSAMESIAHSVPYPVGALQRIVITEAHAKLLTYSLVRMGFSDAMMFPDLDGLARELRRNCEY